MVLQCMEVWGGNQAVESSVTLSGLDAWVFSVPHKGGGAGGDIHYVSSCATGRINRLLVADVSGHGESVAEVARHLRDLMRRFVNHLDQRAFVRSLNREFAAIAQTGRFATAVITTYWSPTGVLQICNAGHQRPLLYRARTGEWTFVTAAESRAGAVADLPLGILDVTQYGLERGTLAAGDMVLLYTESIPEAETAAGEVLGEPGLLELVRRLPPEISAAPDVLIRTLHRAVRDFRGGAPEDDETLLLFRPNDLAPTLTVAERLQTLGRLARGAMASLRPGGPPVALPDFSVENIGGFLVPALNGRRKDSA